MRMLLTAATIRQSDGLVALLLVYSITTSTPNSPASTGLLVVFVNAASDARAAINATGVRKESSLFVYFILFVICSYTYMNGKGNTCRVGILIA